MFDQPVSKRYAWGTVGWIAGFMFAVIAVHRYGEALPEGSVGRIALSLTPLVVLVLGIRVDLTFYRGLDEMQRMIALECSMLAGYAMMLVAIAAMLLEQFAGLPRMPSYGVLVAGGVGSMGGWLYVRRKYQ